MGLYQCEIFSEELDSNTAFYVSIPKRSPDDLEHHYDRKYQVLYLLHGGGDDYTKWVRRVPIERMTRKYNLAVVIPDASLSYYADIDGVGNYFSYITKELPEIVQMYFPISGQREDKWIAGLSMGGYGAYKAALNHPDQYCAAASFSGALDIIQCSKLDPAHNKEIMSYDLEKIKNSENDLIFVLNQLIREKKEVPMLYQSCGTTDFIYPMNQKFKRELQGLPQTFQYTYEEWKGVHDWDFWEESLKHALEWFDLKKRM
jgi:putative tributyrin esterase